MNTFLGSIPEGIQYSGTYNRQQEGLQPNTTNITEISDLIKSRVEEFSTNPGINTRLDLRIKTNLPIEILSNIQLPNNTELDCILNPATSHRETSELHVGYNLKQRQLTLHQRQDIKSQITRYKNRPESNLTTSTFEQYALNQLALFKSHDYYFQQNNDLSATELFELWNNTFDASLLDCQEILDKDKVYAIRTPEGEVIATLLHSNSESNDWAVTQELRQQKLITPLLIYSNSQHILSSPEEPLYAHLRYNRSVSAGLRTGFQILPSEHPTSFLSNHVEVQQELTHFQTGTLNPAIYTERILNQYTQ